jgi:beta-lactamase superfamily II metal-dependent hydrolase
VSELANNLALARVRAHGSTFLLADNATTNDQAALVREIAEPSTVLVAPKKIAPEFFGAVSPQFALVFAGRTARDKPAPDLLAALAPATILRTDERGVIEFIVDAQAIAVKTMR